jgi:hypothetical protein
MIFTRPRASPPIVGRLGHPLLHMKLETQLWRVLVSSDCCSFYRVADPFSSWGTFSSSFIRVPVFHQINDCEHPLLYLPGTGIASQETAMSGSCQQNLGGICNSVCFWWLIMVWIYGWGSLCMVLPSVSAPNFEAKYYYTRASRCLQRTHTSLLSVEPRCNLRILSRVLRQSMPVVQSWHLGITLLTVHCLPLV